jgi:hypothetical protein
MKKITLYLIGLTVLLLSACDLNKFPQTAINTEEAMESAADCQQFRYGLYANTKGIFTGAFIYGQDLQADLYHAVDKFGNWQGPFYSYQMTTSEDTPNSAWFGLYAAIGNANFLTAGCQKLLEKEDLSDADKKLVQLYYGEACYLRAHFYFNLTQYFCEDYDPGTAGDKLGVPVVLEYAPTGDATKYPARGTLAATYEQIVADLAEAEKYITTKGEVNSNYITKDVVTAMQARVALTMHDWSTAYTKASSLVESGTYKFVDSKEALAEAWTKDNLSECLWQAKMIDASDRGNSYSYFIYNTTGEDGEDDPQYIPEDWCLNLYAEDDVRWAWFDKRDIHLRVTGSVYLLVKYPGNPALQSNDVSNYCNMPKIFNIGEQHLIAAEAAYNLGDYTNANKYLNALRSARIPSWTTTDYSGLDLFKEIRDERVRELYGEGFRLNDLKRWHMGFTRSKGQDPSILFPGRNYVDCTREADDPFFLWPIPKDECQANPQMVQNSAYVL